jgi:multiple sugar transport system substrate-binding protein
MQKSTTNLSRRAFLQLLGMTTASAALASCTGQPANTTRTNSGPVQLVYQDWRTEWFPAMAQEMLGKFNAENPNIQVFYTPDPENKNEKMTSDFAAGSAPDILSGCCDFFPAWANAGYLLDLRQYVDADLEKGIIDEWSAAQYNAFFTSDGKQFALPMYHGALALYYNKDLFDAANIDYPNETWTHDEYLDAMKKLTLKEGNQVMQWGSMFDIAWERIQMHVNGWGGHYINLDDHTQCEMAAPSALEAMEWLRARLWDDDVMATSLDVQNLSTSQAFIQQKVAMVEDGSWALKNILENASFSVGVAPFPSGPQRKVTLATTDGFAIYAGTKHPDAAWEFLKFLISKDYGRAMAQTHLLQPARTSLVPDWVDFIRQQYPEKANNMELTAFADGHLKGYSVIAETFTNMVGVSKIAEEAWDQIFTLGQAPVTLMETVCQQIELIQQQTSQIPISCACKTQG